MFINRYGMYLKFLDKQTQGFWIKIKQTRSNLDHIRTFWKLRMDL